jgi:hypothetical protein
MERPRYSSRNRTYTFTLFRPKSPPLIVSLTNVQCEAVVRLRGWLNHYVSGAELQISMNIMRALWRKKLIKGRFQDAPSKPSRDNIDWRLTPAGVTVYNNIRTNLFSTW